MCYDYCGQELRGGLRAGSNPQMDRLRYSSDVHVSLDDEEMREVDPDEHRETLGAGIPQHLGQNNFFFLFAYLLIHIFIHF